MSAVVESLNPFAGDKPAGRVPAAALAPTSTALAQQQREIAETQAKFVMAQRFPRDPVQCMDEILNAFTRPRLAEAAQYQYSKGGSDVSGPSIRSAEAIAQLWGNIEFGFREITRGTGADGVTYSEVEAYAQDLQKRTFRPLRFIVRHWRDTRKGGHAITDEREIYELMANMAQRRVRACILAVIPGDVVDAAMEQADVTLRAKADVSPEAQHKMVEAFAQFGVTKEHIEQRIQRRLDAIQPAQMVTLKRIFASLRDGMSTPAEWFEVAPPPPSTAEAVAEINAKVAAARKPPIPTSVRIDEQTAAQLREREQQRAAALAADQADAPEPPPFTFAKFLDLARAAKTLDEVDELASLITAYPRDQQPELSEEIGRTRKRINAGAAKK